MPYDTPEALWPAMQGAAAETQATGMAAPLPEAFAGCLVVLVDNASPLAERIRIALAAADGSDLLPPYPPRCANCRWRDGVRCRVDRPEVFHPLGTVWPEVALTDWCGRWQGVEVPNAA